MPKIKKKSDSKKAISKKITAIFIAILVIVGVGGYFGVTGFMEYQITQAAASQTEQNLEKLQIKESQVSNDLNNLQKDFESTNQDIVDTINSIYPPNEDYTELARDLDNVFKSIGNVDDIFLSDISFQNPIIQEEAEYAVLPFSLSLTAQEDKFKEFLQYVERTGELVQPDRILEINSISLSYREEENEQGDIETSVNASLSMNAYFQKPANNEA